MDFVDKLFEEACSRLGFQVDQVEENIRTRTIQGYIVNLAFSLTSRPIENAYLAGAIAIRELYRNAPTQIRDYVETFKKHLRPDVADFLIRHQDQLQEHLQFSRDFQNTYFSAGTMIETYLARLSYDESPKEIPQMALLRIAVGEFCQERRHLSGDIEDPLKNILQIYERYSRREITPASPTFFNEGFVDGAPISCMIYTIADDMEDILSIIMEAGLASKNSAGLGIDFTNLRHSAIGRKGVSQGVIPLLKIWDDLMKYINQGGHRNGACTASLRCFHYDLPEFIRLLDKTNEEQSRVSRLNLSIMVSDLFMKRVQAKQSWRLFCPKQAKELIELHGFEFEQKYQELEEGAELWNEYEKYQSLKKLQLPELENRYLELQRKFEGKPIPRRLDSRKVDASNLMRSICDMQIKAGGPYIVYSCNVNRKNSMMNIGPIRSSNLCQETMIPAVPREQTGSCNLAAISLPAFVRGKEFDFIGLGQAVKDAVISLNQVIDSAVNVSEKVKRSNTLGRPLGIGVSGFSDMLALMDLPMVQVPKGIPDYSPKALLKRIGNPEVDLLNWKIWSCMYFNALTASMEEAKKFGPCPGFQNSPISEGKLQFHLWQEEALQTGRKYPFRLSPASPSEWGQSGDWLRLIVQIMAYGVRNMLLLSVQPTASSAQLIGNCETTELHMSNIYNRKVLSGEYPIFNHHLVRDLEALQAWNKEIYNNIVDHDGSVLSIPETAVEPHHVPRLRFLKEKYLTMWEVPQKIIVNLAAQRQICICQSQSMNLYIPSPTIDQMMGIHRYTWEMGLKTGIYYLRTKASSQALKIGREAPKSLIRLKAPSLIEQYDDELLSLIEMTNEAQEKEKKLRQESRKALIHEALPVPQPGKEACQRSSDCLMCNN